MANNAKKLVISGIIILIAALFLYIFLPFIFMGPAAPFFVIHNHDAKSHEVVVEVFDQDNKSIINETYHLEPEDDFSQARPLSLQFQREKREYMFKVTMDKQVASVVKMEIPHSHTLVNIRLYSKDYESGEIVPISMKTAAIV